jgi:putative DNA methylase
MRSTMPKQAIQTTWDFAEGSPFGESSSGFIECIEVVAKVIVTALTIGRSVALQLNARDGLPVKDGAAIVSTDPVWSKNSRGLSFVVFEQPTQPFTTLN